MTSDDLAAGQVARLSCWSGPVDPRPLVGTSPGRRFQVTDGGAAFQVRLGGDLPSQGILFDNLVAAARAAAAIGLGPEVVHHEPGVLVTRAVEGRIFEPGDLKLPGYRREIVELIATCHREGQKQLRGPALIFWPPHVIRGLGRVVMEGEGAHREGLPDLLAKSDAIAAALGPVDPVFAHNDLLTGHFVDDGERLWLTDWDHAAFGAPLFDLANLAVKNGFGGEDEEWLLGYYFQRIPDAPLWRRYRAMACAALLLNALQGMAADLESGSDPQSTPASESLARFERAYEAFAGMMEISL